MRALGIQSGLPRGAATDNIEALERMVTAEIARHQPDLVLLPELFATGLCFDRAAELAEAGAGPGFGLLRELARRHRLVTAGSAWERQGDRVYNALAVFGPGGVELARYRKVHLFRPMGEHLVTAPGDGLAWCDIEGFGRLGLAICYDVRFPELFRALAAAGCIGFLIPAAFPAARIGNWRVLSRARAIENQAFVIAVNHAADGDPELGGNSLIVDPGGNLLAAAGRRAGSVVADLDPTLPLRARAALPALSDIRPDSYRILPRRD